MRSATKARPWTAERVRQFATIKDLLTADTLGTS